MTPSEHVVPQLPECLVGLGAQVDSEKEVLAVVRAIENQAAEAVRNLVLTELDTPAGAAAVTTKLLPLLHWSVLRYDNAKGHPSPNGCICPESEPIPPPIDSWARGAVPCKLICSVLPRISSSPRSQGDVRNQKMDEGSGSLSLLDGAKGKEAVVRGALSATGSRNNHDSARNSSGKCERMGWVGGDEGTDDVELLTSLSEDAGREETLAGAGGIGDAIGRGHGREERFFLEGLKRWEEARTRELTDTRARLEREDKENQERNENMKKDMKGKNWVWGPDGEVLVLDIVSPEKMPVRLMPKFGVRDCTASRSDDSGKNIDVASCSWRGSGGVVDSAQTLEVSGDTKFPKEEPPGDRAKPWDVGGRRNGGGSDGEGANGGGARKVLKGERATRKGGAAAQKIVNNSSDRFFEASATSQPSFLDSLDLQAGVCVKEGDRERQGLPFEKDHMRVSRRSTPKELVSKDPSPTRGIGSANAGGDQNLRSRKGRSLDPPHGRGRASHGEPLSSPATYPVRSASIGSREGWTNRASPGRNSLVDNVKILDPLSGATRLEPVGAGAARGEDQGLRRGRRLIVPRQTEPEAFGVGSDDDLDNDPHMRLFKDGRSLSGGGGGGLLKPVPPPPLPRKRGPRKRHGVLVQNEVHRPRDRGNRLPATVERKHLPAPPLGETMGHGLTPPRDRGTGGATSRSTIGAGKGAGGRSPPDSYTANKREGSATGDPWAKPATASCGGGRKRKGVEGAVNTRSTMQKGEPGGTGNSEQFPGIGKQQGKKWMSLPPGRGDGGAREECGVRNDRKTSSGLRTDCITSRHSQGTLHELLRTT